MQISFIPGGGSWSNPAAQNQQALGENRPSQASTAARSVANTVDSVEQSGKAGDRDAQERYLGGNPSGEQEPQKQQSEEMAGDSKILHLPAIGDSESSSLDLLG